MKRQSVYFILAILLSQAFLAGTGVTADSTIETQVNEDQLNAYLVIRESNSSISYRIYNSSASSWGVWRALPGAASESPAAALADGKLYVVVRGLSGSSFWFGSVNLADNTFSGWSALAGQTSAAPTLVSNGMMLALVVKGYSNGNLWYRLYNTQTQIWGAWKMAPSGSTSSSIAAAFIGNILHLAVKGASSNFLYTSSINTVNDAFSGWTQLVGSSSSAPALATLPNGTMYLAIKALDNRVSVNKWNGSAWVGWNTIPSGATSNTPAVTVVDNKLHIVVVGLSSPALWHNSMDISSNTFSGWTGVSGLTPSKPTLASGFDDSTPTGYEQLRQEALNVLRTSVVKVNGYDAVPPILQPPYNMLYCWDTYFTTLGLIRFNSTLARENINAQFSVQNVNGMIPNAPSDDADQDMRSQPPLLSDAVWEYYLQTHDLSSLRTWYPKLEKYYSWYNSSGTPLGATQWTTSALTGRRYPWDGNTAFYIVASTGMDNYPTYDVTSGVYTQKGSYYYLGYSDLLLSSAMANFAGNLALMSNELGYFQNVTIYNNEFIYRGNAINNFFWNSTGRFYAGTVSWTGIKDTVRSQAMFTPMFANVPTAANASQLVLHYNPNEFNRTYGVPTIAANDSKYYSPQPFWMRSGDPTYWRGNNWVYTTYLTYKGLKNYGYDAEAHDIAKKWLDIVKDSTVPFAEYYDARTGQGYQANAQNYTPNAAITLLFIEREFMM